MLTMRDANSDICSMIARAKAGNRWTDADVAAAVDMAAGTIRNKRCARELPFLSFWAVAVIADFAGFKVEFVRKDGEKKG